VTTKPSASELAEIQRIWSLAIDHVNDGAFRSAIHGPEHWTRVERNGLFLCEHVPEADPFVVRLFAACHDAARQNDGVDAEHGPRAAELVRQWRPRLDAEQLERLIDAVFLHTTIRDPRDRSPTLRVCLDADRLDIARAGLVPDPRYMATPVARQLARDDRITSLDALELPVTHPELLRPTPSLS
jgi:uncharacterized protein